MHVLYTPDDPVSAFKHTSDLFLKGPPGILGLKGDHGYKGEKVPTNAHPTMISIVVRARLGFSSICDFCRVTAG